LDQRKWERYLGPLYRLCIAFPVAVARLEEIPQPCGVLVLGGKGWRVARRAPATSTAPVDQPA
jgi:hypothetical protein